jgi:hypothetical protein
MIEIEATGSELAAWAAPFLDDENLLGWVGWDEPLWTGRTVEEMRTQIVEPLRLVDPHRPLAINHAPRGSTTVPLGFDLLLPWMELSDVASMDIYPVPEGNGHSMLPNHPGLSAVGAHTEILRNLVRRSGNPQPVFMVLLGAGLGRIPNERWEALEKVAETDDLDSDAVKGAIVCDVDGDGAAEVVLVAATGSNGALRVYDFGDSPFGEPEADIVTPPDLEVSGLRHIVCAETDGDGRGDIVLLVDGGPARQDLWLARAGHSGLEVPSLRYRATKSDVCIDDIQHAFGGDFDGDGCGDVLVSYDYPDGTQAFSAVLSDCTGFSSESNLLANRWYESISPELDLDAWPLAVSGDFGGGKQDDLVMARTTQGVTQINVLLSTGTGLTAPARVLRIPSEALDLRGAWVAAGEFDDAPGLDLAVVQGARLLLLSSKAAGRGFRTPEIWYSAGGLDASTLIGVVAGDIDGDSRVDLGLLDSTPGGRARFRLAASTGTYFGARDPTVEELRFMWSSALAHGAAGVVSWCQHFASASDSVWNRLTAVAGEFSALRTSLAGATLSRSSSAGHTSWWVSGVDGCLHLMALNETRKRDLRGVESALPAGFEGSGVLLWSPEHRDFFPLPEVRLSGRSLVDPRPFKPYEFRVYRITE